MTRLLDLGLERITEIIMNMAKLSEMCVINAIESYENGIVEKNQVFEWSEKLKIFQLEISDLATELIFRYQPVATDLRYIRSCMEIAYGFSRFGRYAYDIVEVLETMGSSTSLLPRHNGGNSRKTFGSLEVPVMILASSRAL